MPAFSDKVVLEAMPDTAAASTAACNAPGCTVTCVVAGAGAGARSVDRVRVKEIYICVVEV